MSFMSKFYCYDALGVLQAKEVREIVSQFHCDFVNDAGEKITLGIWAKAEGNRVEPFYLNESQIEEVKTNIITDSVEY